MSLKVIKNGNSKYYAIHKDEKTPEIIKTKLLNKEVEQSYYCDPYRFYKIIKE